MASQQLPPPRLISTTRASLVLQHREACRGIARKHGCEPQPDSVAAQQSPFTVILPPQLVQALLDSSDGSGCGSSGSAQDAGDSEAPSEAAAAAGTGSSVAQQLAGLRAGAPIWQHPPQLDSYAADRNAAKVLAAALAQQLQALSVPAAA